MGTDQRDDERDDDLDAILRECLEEEEPVVTEAQIEAMLADPTFARIAARSAKPYEGLLTEKAQARALRTLAVVFLTDPHAAEVLARARQAGPLDASVFRASRAAATATHRRGGAR